MILVEIVTRLSLVVADSLVLMGTWRATGGMRMITHGDSDRALLTRCLFRDGKHRGCLRISSEANNGSLSGTSYFWYVQPLVWNELPVLMTATSVILLANIAATIWAVITVSHIDP